MTFLRFKYGSSDLSRLLKWAYGIVGLGILTNTPN